MIFLVALSKFNQDDEIQIHLTLKYTKYKFINFKPYLRKVKIVRSGKNRSPGKGLRRRSLYRKTLQLITIQNTLNVSNWNHMVPKFKRQDPNQSTRSISHLRMYTRQLTTKSLLTYDFKKYRETQIQTSTIIFSKVR